MTSPPVAASATLLSYGAWTLRPRFPIDTRYKAPSVQTSLSDPQVAHYAEARDPQRRRPRVFTLRHEEDRPGWLAATVQVLLNERPEFSSAQSSSEVYAFTVELEEIVHPIPS